MKSNMGTTDRVLRMIAGLVIVALYLTHRISGTVAIVLGAIAVAFFVSSFIAWCPAYAPFGWSTRKKE
ncbi:MAG TPA: DUF2892 domain-containing protein [Gemmatimonadales bacterium]|nr:DUF2892 domain-containing protein [Gemmatimonadales bacterium]